MPSQPSLQAVLIDDIAVADLVLIEHEAWMRSAQQLRQCFLVLLDQAPAKIHFVEFNHVEGAELSGVVVTPGTQQFKGPELGLSCGDDLAGDHVGTRR